jgi:DNA-binding NarL/FixJ family response regulator
VRAIRAVTWGASIIDPALAPRLLTAFKRVWQQPAQTPRHGLTEREVTLPRRIAAGRSNKKSAISSVVCPM